MLQFLEKLKSLPALRALKKLRMNKGIALGLVCVLLLVSFLLPKGGGRSPDPVPATESTETPTAPPTTEPPAPEEPEPLRQVEGLRLLPEESVSGLCRDGDGAAVLLTRWDDDARVWRVRMVTLDPKSASVSAEVELEPMGESASYATPVLSETEIRFVDVESERCIAFDRSGRFLGQKDHPVMSREHLGWRNVLLSDDCFYKDTGWAEFSRSDSGRLNRVVGFYDEKDGLHVVAEPYDLIQDVNGHRLLTLRFGEDGAEELSLLDLDAKLCLDRLRLSPEEGADGGLIHAEQGLLGENWALLSLSREGDRESERRICFWYPEADRQSPIEAELLTEQDLYDGIDALAEKLSRTGLILHLDEAPAAEQTPTTGLSVFENSCETGASLFGQYWILSQLEDFVQKLPDGMIRELTEDPGSGKKEDQDALHVYIVRKIPGDASAFASAWMEPTMICFATEEFSRTQLAHEFMHIIDLRLQRYLSTQRQDLESAWRSLSPSYAYDLDLTQEQSDALEPYFVSRYARTNSAEDRAETFQVLFDCEEPVAEAWWYSEHPGVQAKARWLADEIRAAFPSVQAVEQAWWEKLPAAEEE